MVGTLTRNKCDTCRKRKKKCDEKKPACLQCVRSGWVCPGYTLQWKFIEEGTRLAQYYAGKRYVYDDDPDLDFQEGRNVPTTDHSEEGSRIVLSRKSVHRDPSNHQDDETSIRILVPRYQEIFGDRLGSELVYLLQGQARRPLIALHLMGSYFDIIPPRLGHNPALDDAVSCVCAIYSGRVSSPYSHQRDVYRSYAKALASLRDCLGNPSLQYESETLCGSILLSSCELVLSEDRRGWSQLSRGTASLLYQRGSHRYTTAFDRSMLESQLGFILAQSLRSGQDSFLSTPEWRELLTQDAVWPFQQSQTRSLSLRFQLCGLLSGMPSLVKRCAMLKEKHFTETEMTDSLGSLIQEVTTLFDQLQTWLALEFESWRSQPSSRATQSVLHKTYPDLIYGVVDCVAHTSLLVINQLLSFLCHMRLQLAADIELSDAQRTSDVGSCIRDPEIIRQWHERAISAFRFVEGESILAAKPLDYGLRIANLISSSQQNDRIGARHVNPGEWK